MAKAKVEKHDDTMTNPVNLEVRCSKCGVNKHTVEDVMVSTNEAEQWDAVEKVMVPLGWKIEGGPGKRHAICPHCLKAREIRMELPPFDHKKNCPKCGHKEVSMTHRFGNEPHALVECEHIERECQRCHYKWPMSTADAPIPLGDDVAEPSTEGDS